MCQSPADDTPPAYDDVMEKLPSYQDAIQMSEKVKALKTHTHTLSTIPKIPPSAHFTLLGSLKNNEYSTHDRYQ